MGVFLQDQVTCRKGEFCVCTHQHQPRRADDGSLAFPPLRNCNGDKCVKDDVFLMPVATLAKKVYVPAAELPVFPAARITYPADIASINAISVAACDYPHAVIPAFKGVTDVKSRVNCQLGLVAQMDVLRRVHARNVGGLFYDTDIDIGIDVVDTDYASALEIASNKPFVRFLMTDFGSFDSFFFLSILSMRYKILYESFYVSKTQMGYMVQGMYPWAEGNDNLKQFRYWKAFVSEGPGIPRGNVWSVMEAVAVNRDIMVSMSSTIMTLAKKFRSPLVWSSMKVFQREVECDCKVCTKPKYTVESFKILNFAVALSEQRVKQVADEMVVPIVLPPYDEEWIRLSSSFVTKRVYGDSHTVCTLDQRSEKRRKNTNGWIPIYTGSSLDLGRPPDPSTNDYSFSSVLDFDRGVSDPGE